MGYHNKRWIGEDKKVFIPLFSNRTSETGLEVYFTRSIQQELLQTQWLKLARKNNQADYILKGTIIKVETSTVNKDRGAGQGLKYLPSNRVLTTEYLVRVTVELSLIEKENNKMIWREWVTEDKSFESAQLTAPIVNSANINYNESSKARILKDLSEIMMHEAFDRLTENF